MAFFEGVEEIEIVIVQPPHIRRWVTTPERIQLFAAELKKAVKLSEQDDAPMKEGSHCRWCPAQPTCPRFTGAVDRALKTQIDALDTTEINAYLKNAELLEGWIKSLRELAVVVLANKDGSSAPNRITNGLEALLLSSAQDPDASKLLQQAKAIFAGLQEGRLDRTLFTANANAYFTAEVIEDYAASLKPMGEPKSFELSSSGLRGGFTQRSYRLVYPAKTLRLVVRAATDGKLEQFQISE